MSFATEEALYFWSSCAMERILRLVIFCGLLSVLPQSSLATITDLVTNVWDKFWLISCEFSTFITSRSKRSIELPNLHNAEELYNYLYPSFDVKPEDFLSDGRSLFSFSWLSDIMEYWETECHHRNQSASKARQKDEDPPDFGSYSGNLTVSNGTDNNSSTVVKKMDQLEKNMIKDPRNKTKVDKFFTVYGGDVEYFYPVWGMGIPFDGEITILGFHGFKGIFPYR